MAALHYTDAAIRFPSGKTTFFRVRRGRFASALAPTLAARVLARMAELLVGYAE
jgi:hypothetical protein